MFDIDARVLAERALDELVHTDGLLQGCDAGRGGQLIPREHPPHGHELDTVHLEDQGGLRGEGFRQGSKGRGSKHRPRRID